MRATFSRGCPRPRLPRKPPASSSRTPRHGNGRACLAWVSVLLAWQVGGSSLRGEPLHLAVLPLDAELRPAADLLTAELSKDGRVALLERAWVGKVVAEQSLNRGTGGGE